MNKKLYYLFAFLLANNQCSAGIDYRISFKGREWEFLHHEINIASVKHTFFHDAKKSCLFVGFCVLFPSIITALLSKNVNNTIVAGSFGFFGGILSMATTDNITLKKSKIKALVKLIQDWPNNKEFTPICYHDSFEQLYALYTKEGKSKNFKKQIRSFYSLVKQALEHRFPEYYLRFETQPCVQTTPTTFSNTYTPPHNPALRI